MAGSDYQLRLRATLDTTQVQQELKKLRSAQAMVLDPGGSGTNKGLQGVSHMQKIEVQLTKLNSSIAGLQRAIEQLSRSNNMPQRMPTVGGGGRNQLPILPRNSQQTQDWLNSSQYKSLQKRLEYGIKSILSGPQRYTQFRLRQAMRGVSDPNLMAHELITSGALKGIRGLDEQFSLAKYRQQYKDYTDYISPNLARKNAMSNASFGRQMASYIGGQMLGGAGELATGLGYKRTGAVLGGIGEGVTAGGSMAFTASLMGAGAAAGPIGIIVGLGSAALAVTKSLNEMNEASKQAAENQRKVADALLQTSIAQSTERYGTWQGVRAQQALNENNLPVAKERAAYFKKELNKSQGIYFSLQDPKAYEEKIRKDAELKKNLTVTERRVVSGGGTATGNYSTSFQEYKRGLTDEEKAEIDKAANESILAYQKKFEVAKKEYQAALQNSKTWDDVAKALQNQKDAADKMSRETRNQEFLKRRQLREGALFAAESYIQSDRIRSTQIMAMDIMNNKQSSPLEKFNKIAEELDKLRSNRKSLVEQAYSINKDIAKGGRDSNELADMTRRRDQLLKDAGYLAQRAGILESELGNISTSTLAPDISHMTSLAQYGFNMGEKDNSVERMEKYYNRSLTLQQQIKDKLQEGIKTEAVYN